MTPAPTTEGARRRNALWRLALGLPLVLAVYAVSVAGLAGLLRLATGPDAVWDWFARIQTADGPAATLMLLFTFSGLVAGTLAAGGLLHRRGVFDLAGPPRALARDLALGLGVAGPLLLAALGLGLMQIDVSPNHGPGLWLALLPLALLGLAVQTGAEELLFRGYLQSQLAARFPSPWVWIPLPALLFGAAHFDPASAGGNATAIFAAATLFGLFAADLTARTGTIGVAWGFHLANNASALLLVALPDSMPGLALYTADVALADSGTGVLILQDMLTTTAIWAALRLALARRG